MYLFATGETRREFIAGLLSAPFAGRAFRRLEEEGKLRELLPEVSAMRGVAQPPEFHPEGDVFEHTMVMLDHMVFPDELLGWSVLLHDVGKPAVRSVEDSGRIRFFGHEEKGAEMAEEILTRLGVAPEDRAVVVHAVREHMRFASVRMMRPGKLRALLRAKTFPLELELHRLDCISSHGLLEGFDFLLSSYLALPAPEPPPLLTGHDLLALGLPPGPGVGAILSRIRELRQKGLITGRDQALARAEQLAKELKLK